MARYVLTEPAAADLRGIARYVRERSPRSAKQVRADLRAAMRKLADFPHMGHFRPDLTTHPLRFWAVYSYVIAYRPESKPLEVVRIFHGARDMSGGFR